MEGNLGRAWFAQQVQDAKQTMFRMAYSILGNIQDCEDAASGAVLHAYEKLRQLKHREYFRTWLLRILKNECYALLRRRKRTFPLEEAVLQTDGTDIADPDLHRALMRLNTRERTSIVLHHLEGYRVEEIAVIMGKPQGTVKSWLSRGREKLRAMLEEKES